MKNQMMVAMGVMLSCLATTAWSSESPLEWSSDDGSVSLKVGGVVRFNHRYESWPESKNRGLGKTDFDIFRLDITGKYDDVYLEGRFGAGLPRVSDGSLLFLMHLISKMRQPDQGSDQGSRIGIILNGSPLFTGSAGSGESEIRRYILEADLLEAIIALPTDMFYNTGIATYVWVLSNKKETERKGKVHLINAANPDKKVVGLVGDGGLMLGIGEVATMVQENTDMVLMIMNDGGYGVMRGIQNNYFNGRQYYNELHTPDYKLLGESMGVKSWKVGSADEFKTAIQDAVALNGPAIIELDMHAIGPLNFAGPPQKKLY